MPERGGGPKAGRRKRPTGKGRRAGRRKPGKGEKARQADRKSGGKSLVIVESPAKSRTINKVLGDDFVVRASMGHVRDLPQRNFGIDPENDFKPTYKLITRRRDVVRELRELARNAPKVYLATDPDREGEAISWHLIQTLKLPGNRFARVRFHEITRDSVRKAFERPGGISMDLVHAQQTRRILDRIVGYKLSPLLWKKIARRLSAGRVQSAALKLIVDRERGIQAFKPVEYWDVRARLAKGGTAFTARLVKVSRSGAPLAGPMGKEDVRDPELRNEEEAAALVEVLRKGPFRVVRRTERERRDRPYPPFTTSLLQQRASIELGFSAKRTMAVAQQLYEGIEVGQGKGRRGVIGLITYMRTDSVRIAEEAVRRVREFIAGSWGRAYLPEKPNTYRRKSTGAQEAHEAIRPTNVDLTPEAVRRDLTADQYKLYNLIWTRFVACQMAPAVYFTTELEIHSGPGVFLARGRRLTFDGYLRVFKTTAREKFLPDSRAAGTSAPLDESSGLEEPLPDIREGETVDLVELVPTQHFTEPPPRFTEASLIKTLEKYGIGRPSTYASTLSTLVDRGYVRVEDRKLVPSDLGVLVTGKLERHFQHLIDTKFTAEMEEALDRVARGEAEWTDTIRRFYDPFLAELEKATVQMESEDGKPAGEQCPRCGTDMVVRWTRSGKVIQCVRETCGFKKAPGSEVPGQECDACSAPMIVKWGRRGKFLACTKYPDCTYTRSILRGDKVVRPPKGWEEPCEKCGRPLAVRVGRRGAFVGCTGYPECRNVKKIPPEWIHNLYPSRERTEMTRARNREEGRGGRTG